MFVLILALTLSQVSSEKFTTLVKQSRSDYDEALTALEGRLRDLKAPQRTETFERYREVDKVQERIKALKAGGLKMPQVSEPLSVGKIGLLPGKNGDAQGEVLQVLGPREMMVKLVYSVNTPVRSNSRPRDSRDLAGGPNRTRPERAEILVLIRGLSTERIVARQRIELPELIEVIGNYEYKSSTDAKTVPIIAGVDKAAAEAAIAKAAAEFKSQSKRRLPSKSAESRGSGK